MTIEAGPLRSPEADNVVLTGRQSLPPIEFNRAAGSWLYDIKGKEYLDASSGSICVNIGHAHPHVVYAMQSQLAKGAYTTATIARSAEMDRLGARLTATVGRPDDKVILTTTGTSAIELAISLARMAQRARGQSERNKILTASLGYHGNSALTLGLSGHRRRRPSSADAMGLAPSFDPPYPGQHPACDGGQCTADCADDVARAIRAAGPETVAAVLIEPINGATGGAYVPPPGYHARLKEICQDQGVLLLHDEILTGLGRTGLPMSSHHWPSAQPDIAMVSKGLNGGYTPLAATVISTEIADDIAQSGRSLPLLGTMSGTPLQVAVGNAVLDVLQELGAVASDATRGNHVAGAVQRATAGLPVVVDVRGRGYLHGIEVADNCQSDLLRIGRDKGLILYPFNGYRRDGGGEGVLIAPPLNISDDEVSFLASALRSALVELSERKAEGGAPLC
ncbi:aspartate aminotransferase family protein [Streptomyces canus]|uniref:aminotransferase family protein n=1 Tax=Streptomyces canus TaxID=58343 RepID=UPI0033A68303